MTFEEALKEIEILKLQNKKMGEAFDSLDKKYDLLKLELELAQACHKEKCAEFNKLCFDYAKLQVKNEKFEQNMKNVLEIEKKNAVKEFLLSKRDWLVTKVHGQRLKGGSLLVAKPEIPQSKYVVVCDNVKRIFYKDGS